MQALVALLMAAYVSMAIWSSVHLDMARDMRVALDIRDGIAFPLVGPIMAGHLRLGPVWYYFLALLGSFGAGWFGTVFLLALGGAVQFALAYLAGKEWKDRATGLLWAVLLLVPSWSTFEQFNPTHTQLTALLALAFLLCALRFYRRGAMKYFIAASFRLFSGHSCPSFGICPGAHCTGPGGACHKTKKADAPGFLAGRGTFRSAFCSLGLERSGQRFCFPGGLEQLHGQ